MLPIHIGWQIGFLPIALKIIFIDARIEATCTNDKWYLAVGATESIKKSFQFLRRPNRLANPKTLLLSDFSKGIEYVIVCHNTFLSCASPLPGRANARGYLFIPTRHIPQNFVALGNEGSLMALIVDFLFSSLDSCCDILE